MSTTNDPTNDAMQKIAEQLPIGWTVMIELERGSGSVMLFDPDGKEVQMEYDESGIKEKLLFALELAEAQNSEVPLVCPF